MRNESGQSRLARSSALHTIRAVRLLPTKTIVYKKSEELLKALFQNVLLGVYQIACIA